MTVLGEAMLDVGQVAAVLGWPVGSVMSAVASGDLPAVRIGRQLRFDAAAVAGFAERAVPLDLEEVGAPRPGRPPFGLLALLAALGATVRITAAGVEVRWADASLG